eukprot:UN06111
MMVLTGIFLDTVYFSDDWWAVSQLIINYAPNAFHSIMCLYCVHKP